MEYEKKVPKVVPRETVLRIHFILFDDYKKKKKNTRDTDTGTFI